MKIVCISDTHENFFTPENMPEGDILIHAGDFTWKGAPRAVIQFSNWLANIKHKYKEIIVIAGNHDLLFENRSSYARTLLHNCHYLEDNQININGLYIYGSPWQPRFYDWAFNADRGAVIRKIWERIPENTNILITHGPPRGILDISGYDLGSHGHGESCGCDDLKDIINTKLKNLKLHVFGHIHHSYGIKIINNITYVNASSCNEKYWLVNKPIIVEVN